MPVSSPAFCKPIAWFLFFTLIGVYALYEWYDDRLQEQIADKDAQLALSTKAIKKADTQRLESEQMQEALRAQIVALKARHEEALKTGGDLEHDLASLKAAHAAELARMQTETDRIGGEKDQLATAHAALQSRYEEAKEQIMALQNDLSKVQKAIAATAAAHRAKIEELEQHINARIKLSQTTPMDAELLRTAQAVGVLPPDEALAGEQQIMAEQLATTTAKLETLQAEHDAVRQQLAQTQEAFQRAQAEFEQEKTAAAMALDAAKAIHADALAEAESRMTELSRQVPQDDAHAEQLVALQTQIQNDTALIAELKTKVAAAEQTAANQAQETEQQLAALNERLTAERQARDEMQRQQDAALGTLQGKLDETSQKLAAAEAELQAARAQADSTQDTTGQADPALAQEIEAANARIATLEATLEQERASATTAQAGIRAEAESAVASLRALYAGFAELGGTFTERGLLLRLAESELRFPPGQATLPAGQIASLDRIAALLAEQPTLTVRIEGHTDSAGGDELNLPLSRQRAVAVKQALIERGVEPARLTADGLGASRAIASNATAEGRSQNRRVEIYVVE